LSVFIMSLPVVSRFIPQLVLVAAYVLLILTGFAAHPAARVFTVTGIVRSPHADGAITIEHDEIPGFMPAMTMPFYADAADVAGLVPGDRVEFEFHVGRESRATRFKKLPSAPIQQRADTPAPPAAPARRLRAGDTVPPFVLQNQNGERFTESVFKGRYSILTFVFTRCPVPEFCPLISRKFQELQQALADRPAEYQLISITLDPEYDRPEILQAYSKYLDASHARWQFATGGQAEVAKLTRAFAVRTEFNNGRLDHTLATALIGPDGRVIEIWRGNAWKPSEVLAQLDESSAP
jgi:protein SCO1/2